MIAKAVTKHCSLNSGTKKRPQKDNRSQTTMNLAKVQRSCVCQEEPSATPFGVITPPNQNNPASAQASLGNSPTSSAKPGAN